MWAKRFGLICFLLFAANVFVNAQGRNSIEGRILGVGGRGIPEVRVSLKNANYTDVGQDLTDTIGAYRFVGVSDGIYYIDIQPAGTNYEGQTRRVQLQSVSQRPGGAAEIYHFDFQLRPLQPVDKPLPKKLAEALLFVQEVPAEARQKYKDAQKHLERDEKEKAYSALKQSIETFPDYYDALDLLGTEYLKAGKSAVSVPLFLQAVDVNKKGWHAYFGLGMAYGNLNMSKQAIVALKRSGELNPVNTKTFVALGRELSKDKDSQGEAITAFQRAIQLDSVQASDAHAALAAIYSTQGRYKEAADSLETYLKVTPDPGNSGAIREKIKELRKKAMN